MKKIILLILTVALTHIAYSQNLDQATKNKIKVKYVSAEEFYNNGEYYNALDKIEQIEELFNRKDIPFIQNLKVKTLIGLRRYNTAQSELDELYKMDPPSEVINDIATYEHKIEEGIKAEAARKEKARLDKIKREEEARLDKSRREEEARLAEQKRIEEKRIAAEKKRQEEEKLRAEEKVRNKKIFYERANEVYYGGNSDKYKLRQKEVELVNVGKQHSTRRYANFANSEGEIVLSLNDKNSFINSSYSYWTNDFYEGMCSVKEWIGGTDNRCGYINMKGEKVVPFIYDVCEDFREDLAVVGKDTGRTHRWRGFDYPIIKYGYVDKNGSLILPMIYGYAGPFVNGKAEVSLLGKKKRFYINKKGEKVK